MHPDIIDKILLIVERSSVVDGFRSARLDRRRNRIFGLHSRDLRLSRRGKWLRFYCENIDHLHWYHVQHNPIFPIEFYLYNIHRIDVTELSFNPSVPFEFFRDNVNSIHWPALSQNPSIPVEFLRENVDMLDWSNISYSRWLNPD